MRLLGLSLLGLVFLVTSCVVKAAPVPEYTVTPFGRFLTQCVNEVPEGSHFVAHHNGSTTVHHSDGTQRHIPACETQGHPIRLSNRPLPGDYDGWLQYAAVNTSKLGLTGGFDAFTNVMSVPDKPVQAADQLFLFPGLQNIDWIPKVDPEPSVAFDILQPVLQYPSSNWLSRHSWQLKSWYVTVNSGALMTTGVKVEAGDAILCNMTRTGPDSWTVLGTLKSDPKKVTQQSATNSRLKLQPWAYNTLECYGCDGCGTYPKQPITFTENKLYQAGKLVTVPGSSWEINPKPAKKQQCHEKTTIADNGDTTIAFQ